MKSKIKITRTFKGSFEELYQLGLNTISGMKEDAAMFTQYGITSEDLDTLILLNEKCHKNVNFKKKSTGA